MQASSITGEDPSFRGQILDAARTQLRRFVETDGPAAERPEGMVLALHARKRERFADDPAVYQLDRRIVDERPEIIATYARTMTARVAEIIADGVRRREFTIDDVATAANVVRDAVTVFVHPAHVEAGAKAGLPTEAMARHVVRSLLTAFRAGMRYEQGDEQDDKQGG